MFPARWSLLTVHDTCPSLLSHAYTQRLAGRSWERGVREGPCEAARPSTIRGAASRSKNTQRTGTYTWVAGAAPDKGKPGAIRGRNASGPAGSAGLPEGPSGLAGLPDRDAAAFSFASGAVYGDPWGRPKGPI